MPSRTASPLAVGAARPHSPRPANWDSIAVLYAQKMAKFAPRHKGKPARNRSFLIVYFVLGARRAT